jgi:hypothetical protein
MLIKYTKENDTRGIVYFYDYEYTGKITSEENALVVESLPQSEAGENQIERLIINPATLELHYEYVDIPPTPEEKITQLEKQNADLLFENVLQDGRIDEANQSNANLTFELIMKGVL